MTTSASRSRWISWSKPSRGYWRKTVGCISAAQCTLNMRRCIALRLCTLRTLLLFPILNRPRPVVLEEPGEGAVGEQLAAGLATRAIVRLVLGIDDPLDERAANRAGLTKASMHGHAFAKGRYLFGKSLV